MIELAELIRALRSELNVARERAEREALQFELGPIEVELTVAVEKQASGGAKVRFWVVELGGDGALAETSTQRIKLSLVPSVPEAQTTEPKATRTSAFISGEQASAER